MRETERRDQQFYFSESLLAELKKACSYPLIVIEAPMGYGKTTVVREALLKSNTKVLWQNVYNSSHVDFWSSFCTLFKKINKHYEKKLLSLGFPDRMSSLHKALEIVEEIVAEENVTIVIDDFYLIDTPEMTKFFLFLAQNEVSNLYLILISRFFLNLNIAAYTLKGTLYHLKKDSFELGPEEIKGYYGLFQITISSAEAVKLYHLTEGWISALYLIVLNYKNKGSLSELVDIFKLFEQTIYEQLTKQVKKILLIMTLFDSFSGQMVNYILDEPNADIHLKQIIGKNLFIYFDLIDNSYYIHRLFRNFLEHKRTSFEPQFLKEVYQRAADWYIGQKDYIRAMHYSYLSNDFEKLFKILEIDNSKSLNSGHRKQIISYYQDCPKAVKEIYPYAVLLAGMYLRTLNEIGIYNEICNDLIEIINSYRDKDITLYHNLTGECKILFALESFNDIEKMGGSLKEASELLNSPSKCFNSSQPYTYGSPSILYLYYRKSGDLLKDIGRLKANLPYYLKITDGHGRAADDIMNAERLYYVGDFENSEIEMHKIYHLNPAIESGLLLCNMILNIKLYVVKGDYEGVEALFKRVRNIYEKANYIFSHTIDMYETYLYSILEMSDRIKPWILNGELYDTRLYYPATGYLGIIYCRVLIGQGKYLHLIGMAKNLMEQLSAIPNMLGQINLYIFLSIANKKIDRQSDAYKSLKKALDLALPDSMYMPFVENYSHIEAMLKKIQFKAEYKKGIDQIAKIAKTYDVGRAKIINRWSEKSLPSLTKREKEVATLAAQGLSNKEIGRKLYISENTIKTQLKSIYNKFEINSRVLLQYKLNRD